MVGNNRLGKTQWLAYDFTMYARGIHPYVRTPKNAVLWITVLTNDKVEQALLPKFKEMMTEGMYEYNDVKKVFKIPCKNGTDSHIFIKSQEAGLGSFESAKVHRLGFDEQPTEETFNSACVRGVDTGAQVLVAATMWEQDVTWLDDRFIEPFMRGANEAKDVEFVGEGITMYDNPILPKDEVDELFRVYSMRNEEEALVRVMGKRLRLTGKTIFSIKALENYRKNAKPFYEAEFMGV